MCSVREFSPRRSRVSHVILQKLCRLDEVFDHNPFSRDLYGRTSKVVTAEK